MLIMTVEIDADDPDGDEVQWITEAIDQAPDVSAWVLEVRKNDSALD